MAANSAGEREGIAHVITRYRRRFNFNMVQFPSEWTKILTINSNLAVTIRVTGLEERLGLSVSQSSGTGSEVLQEQPGEDDQGENSQRCVQCAFWIFSLK